MDRRSRRQFARDTLVVGLGLLTGCRRPVPPASIAQTGPLATPTRPAARPARVGVLWADAPTDLAAAFGRALAERGYVEGRNVAVDVRWVRARSDLLPDLAAELARLHVDVIVAPSTPAALAARRATDAIPIVMVASGDPVAAELAASLARPGGNVTGLGSFAPGAAADRLGLLREAFPGVARVAVLWDAADPGKAQEVRATQLAGRALGLELRSLAVLDADDIDRALQPAALAVFDALVVLGDALTHACRAAIATLAARRRLPVLYDRREYYVDDGGLMAYGPSFPDLFRRAAAYVDAILRGATPADLPVGQPTAAELVVNLPAAQGLRLTLPPAVLARATEVLR